MDRCYEKEIINLLQTLKGEKIDICGEIYRYIIETDEKPAEIMRFFLENSEDIESSEEKEASKLFTDGELLDCKEKYGKIVNGILKKLLSERKCPTEFYEELWKEINVEQIFDSERSRIFALFYIWIDARIPYYQLPDGLSIEEETYREIMKKMSEKLRRARFILCYGLKEWTQVASLLCQILNEVDDEAEKAVLLAGILQLSNYTARVTRKPDDDEESNE